VQEVEQSDKDVVSALRTALIGHLGRERFEVWFGDNTRLDVRGASLVVCVPNRCYQDWLRTQFRPQLEAACQSALGRCLALSFEIDATLERAASSGHLAAHAAQPAACRDQGGSTEKSERQAPNVFPRRAFAKLESFATGAGNRVAHVAAQDAARQPGRTTPLVVHGQSSTGKTHLLEGVWCEFRRVHPTLGQVFLTAEQFTTSFIGAVRGQGVPSFRRKFDRVGLLLIDDVQFFAGKKATLGEVLHTVDWFLREGRQIVLTCDRAPSELPELGTELVTRLQSGLVCRLELPDLATKREIVRQNARQLDIAAPDDVLEWIAVRGANARELQGALRRVQAAAVAHEVAVSLALAEEALADLLDDDVRLLHLDDIDKAVCQVFGLQSDSLKSSRRERSVSCARMLAMWLARKYTRAACTEIGEYFGRRSHSTVISAQRRVRGWLDRRAAIPGTAAASSVEDALRKVERKLSAG
jgi:chromosomal replication initiator protein